MVDRKETIGLMEPLTISPEAKNYSQLMDLVIEVTAASTGLTKSLPTGVVKALSELVRAMNCYYSNFIEGHNTHPVDIEKALKNDFSQDSRKRDLQLEAKAHIEVQRWIDSGSIRGKTYRTETIQGIHFQFSKSLPEDFLWVEDPNTKEKIKVVPGEIRQRDVKVGQHYAISPGAVPGFLKRYEEVYANLGKAEAILNVAAAHHRLLWIHPFLDGNGRVARFVSYSLLLETLETHSVWSIARGLARNVNEYKQHLMACDGSRRGDLDGRGSLSHEALCDFTKFFLTTCLDQIKFMEGLIQPNKLKARILLWAQEEIRAGELPERSQIVFEEILFRGELPRGEVEALLGISARSARRVVSALIERQVIASDSIRSPLRLAFPTNVTDRWLPGLFPQ